MLGGFVMEGFPASFFMGAAAGITPNATRFPVVLEKSPDLLEKGLDEGVQMRDVCTAE